VFIENTITGKLVVVLSFCFGERYSWLVLFFTLSLDWCRAVLVQVRDTLVAAVGDGSGVSLEVYLGVFEQTKVMSFTWSKVSRYDSFCFLVDDYLALGSVALLLAGVVAPLSFFGRSTGDSLASTRATSMTILFFTRAFLPGKENCLSLMSVSSTQREIRWAVLSLTP
jgi:hypothetical protein